MSDRVIEDVIGDLYKELSMAHDVWKMSTKEGNIIKGPLSKRRIKKYWNRLTRNTARKWKKEGSDINQKDFVSIFTDSNNVVASFHAGETSEMNAVWFLISQKFYENIQALVEELFILRNKETNDEEMS